MWDTGSQVIAINKCVGGISRVYNKLRDLRAQVPDEGKLLFLNAGDFYQGTIW